MQYIPLKSAKCSIKSLECCELSSGCVNGGGGGRGEWWGWGSEGSETTTICAGERRVGVKIAYKSIWPSDWM
jgi:hypothetical protein